MIWRGISWAFFCVGLGILRRCVCDAVKYIFLPAEKYTHRSEPLIGGIFFSRQTFLLHHQFSLFFSWKEPFKWDWSFPSYALMVSFCSSILYPAFYHDEPCCRPYHTFYGDVTCPSQTDSLIFFQTCLICFSLDFAEAIANWYEEQHRLYSSE